MANAWVAKIPGFFLCFRFGHYSTQHCWFLPIKEFSCLALLFGGIESAL
jgi:hypothetical protein